MTVKVMRLSSEDAAKAAEIRGRLKTAEKELKEKEKERRATSSGLNLYLKDIAYRFIQESEDAGMDFAMQTIDQFREITLSDDEESIVIYSKEDDEDIDVARLNRDEHKKVHELLESARRLKEERNELREIKKDIEKELAGFLHETSLEKSEYYSKEHENYKANRKFMRGMHEMVESIGVEPPPRRDHVPFHIKPVLSNNGHAIVFLNS